MTRKQLIIDSALTLFAEKGIEATSIQQITAHCGISKGAFYLSFKSKEELVHSIIEHFMNNINKEVDQAVNQTKNPSEQLHIYFAQTFYSLSKYTSFAEILMQESVSTISKELIEKIQYYSMIANKNLEKLLFTVFGEQINGKQYDLIIIINGMIQAYLKWMFEYKRPFDIEKLASSLVEKITLLALNSTEIFLTDAAIMYPPITNYSIENIIEELTLLAQDTVGEIEVQSAQLLIEELTQTQPRKAIILGLIKNLEANEKYGWVTILLKNYYQ